MVSLIILNAIQKVRDFKASSVTICKGEFGNDYSIKISRNSKNNIKVRKYQP